MQPPLQSSGSHRSVVDNLAVYETPPASPAAQPLQAFKPPLGQFKSGWTGGMEGDQQRQRQYEQSNYPRGYAPDYGAQGSNAPNPQQLRGSQVNDDADRFRQAQLLTSRAPASTPLAAGAGSLQDVGTFSYNQGSQYQTPQMQAPPFSYQSDYLQDPQRQRFPHYPSQVYNVPQQPPTYHALPQPQSQSPYDPPGHFQPRQIAPVEGLPNQFGAPQQYYSAGEAPNASTLGTAISPDYHTGGFHQLMQHNVSSALGRPTLASSYSSAPLDVSQAGNAEEQLGNQTNVAGDSDDRIYRDIRATNDSTSRGMLDQAARTLMEGSNWLLHNAVSLGLTRDDETMREQRLILWDDFNNCWLALLQRQLDETQRRRDTGLDPVPPQTILPAETLQTMGDMLVAHCDKLERFGLVDYQMSVSEEDIIDILLRCVDLLETVEENRGRAESGSTANVPAQRRAIR